MLPIIKSKTSASMAKVRLCRDCKHFQKGTKDYPVHFCQKVAFISLLTGCEEPMPASIARSDTSLCGQGAQYFESKK
jgi:hypothetical protein